MTPGSLQNLPVNSNQANYYFYYFIIIIVVVVVIVNPFCASYLDYLTYRNF